MKKINEKNIATWILAKNETNYAKELLVVRETEKAYLLQGEALNGYAFNFWCPKSAILTDEQAQEESNKQLEKAKKQQAVKNDHLLYNQYLVEFAKENGIKGVRAKMKTATLEAKIEEAGLKAMTRTQFFNQETEAVEVSNEDTSDIKITKVEITTKNNSFVTISQDNTVSVDLSKGTYIKPDSAFKDSLYKKVQKELSKYDGKELPPIICEWTGVKVYKSFVPDLLAIEYSYLDYDKVDIFYGDITIEDGKYILNNAKSEGDLRVMSVATWFDRASKNKYNRLKTERELNIILSEVSYKKIKNEIRDQYKSDTLKLKKILTLKELRENKQLLKELYYNSLRLRLPSSKALHELLTVYTASELALNYNINESLIKEVV